MENHGLHFKYDKAFKSDSQRLAFFIPWLGFVFTVLRLSFVVALLTPQCGVVHFEKLTSVV
ncbi:hypothetical protein F0237_21910 [Vibrio tubiashii]|uniref:Uncharacterized protein n=1 Tax=Vibrio tubiashii TaxID=29498 RepID=A0AAE5LK57_9VIBR|nr:hypothetical protein [Vibrio tubiashii]